MRPSCCVVRRDPHSRPRQLKVQMLGGGTQRRRYSEVECRMEMPFSCERLWCETKLAGDGEL